MAIAFDASGGQRVTGQTNTLGFTVAAGTDKALYAVTTVRDDGTEDVATVKWNGESFTEVATSSSNDVVMQLWVLKNPTSKTDSVVAVGSSDPHSQLIAVLSVTGVDQTASDPNNVISTSHTDYGIAITTLDANSWLFGGIGPRNQNYDITPDYTSVFESDTVAALFSERRAVTTTGSYSLTWTGTGGASHNVGVMEIKEAAGGAFEVTATQTITISSSQPRIKGHNRTFAQSLTHSENIIREGGVFSRIASTVLVHSDSPATLTERFVTATTVLLHAEAIARSFGKAVTAAQTLTHSDSITALTERFVTATQTLTHSESILSAGRTFTRTATTVLIHSESIAILKGFIRTIAQNLTHSESIASLTERFATASQNLTESDSVIVEKTGGGFERVVAQLITHSESIATLTERFVTVSQTLTHSEAIAILREYTRAFAQNLTHSDAIVVLREYIRTASQNLVHSESIIPLTERFVTATQNLIHSESIAKITEAMRTATQSITHSESIVRILSVAVTASQTITHSEVIAQIAVFARSVAQALTHSENIVVEGGSADIVTPKTTGRPRPKPPLQLEPEITEERFTVFLTIQLFKVELISTRITNKLHLTLHQRESLTAIITEPQIWLVKDYIKNKINLVLSRKERFIINLKFNQVSTIHQRYARLSVRTEDVLANHIEQVKILQAEKKELQEDINKIKTSLDELKRKTMSADDVLALFAAD